MTSPTGEAFETADIYNEDGYYAVIPEWVLDADISAQAVRLYAVLRRYADQRTMFAHPSRKTLATRMRVKDEKVVDRALEDLQRIGAVTVVPRWRNEAGEVVYQPTSSHRERTSNGYRLRRAPVAAEGGGGGRNAPTPRRVSPHGGGFSAPGVGAEKGEEPQPPNYSQVDHNGLTPMSSYVGNASARARPTLPPTAELDPAPEVNTGPPAELGGRGHREWAEATARLRTRRRSVG